MALATIARITGVPNRLEIAETAAQSLLLEQSVTPLVAMWAKAGLALLAVQTGDQSAVAEHYSYLLGQQSTMASTVISADRLLGLLSQTTGDLDQATEHFEDALVFCREATGPSWRGPAATTQTCCWNETTKAKSRRSHPCLTSPWPSPASWACGP